MKILIAEDSKSSRMLLEKALRGWDYDVVATENGLQAVAALSDPNIRLAILDWMMPGLDGLSVCRHIQTLPRLVYAILLTGRDGSGGDLARALESGASDYVAKPFDANQLRARLKVGERILSMQRQMGEMQKLESMGRLASGIAHEINTPAQYVGDNIGFLVESLEDLTPLLKEVQSLFTGNAQIDEKVREQMRELIEKSDLEYLLEEIPNSLRQSQEGVERIATIVSSMKEFSHPSSGRKEPLDLKRAIENTLTVARNEWKYVAEMETEFDPELGTVPCLRDEISQVILNLVVNAAHAIGERNESEDRAKGTIRVITRRLEDCAEIRIEDDGTGIPEENRTKVFEPFFTTKPVGVGTGQGLAIARSTVVDKHAGTLVLSSTLGEGSAFTIQLPLEGDNGGADEDRPAAENDA